MAPGAWADGDVMSCEYTPTIPGDPFEAAPTTPIYLSVTDRRTPEERYLEARISQPGNRLDETNRLTRLILERTIPGMEGQNPMKDEAFQALRRDLQERIAGLRFTRAQVRDLHEILALRLDPSSRQEAMRLGPNRWELITGSNSP